MKKDAPFIATYRLQLHPDFNLDEAAGLADYLAALGVSHAYTSPFLQSVPGSLHGYDVVDYTHINQALGGAPALERLVDALHAAGDQHPLGLVMDMVPNHMAIHPSNPWWWDVLENGPSSQYASYFDVEWDPPEARHANAVLLPVLGDHYGRVLEAGDIQLVFAKDTFTVRYYEHVYPVDPGSLGPLLSAAAEHAASAGAGASAGATASAVATASADFASMLTFLGGVHSRLPEASATDLSSARRRYRDAAILRDLLGRLVREQPGAEQAIQATVASINQDPDVLDAFLSRQNYRLALWKISARELGYRRFFDINTMIGMRMESEEVYRDSHRLTIDLLERGLLDGLRIDHPDGLLDPRAYFYRLRASALEAGRPDAWVVIEKILEPGERLPEDWPVQGTTGYDFLNHANGLQIDQRAEGSLSDFYARFTGEGANGGSHAAYLDLVREKKRVTAYDVLGSDLARLTEIFLQITERQRVYRDYTRSELTRTLAETAACLPVYRTYVRPEGAAEPTLSPSGEVVPAVSADDRAYIEQAVDAAKVRRPELDPRLFDFLRGLLLLEYRGPLEAELVQRFQQFTGPVMAKGVEDTVFYIYNRFVSLNEVGGDPGLFGISPQAFHKACLETQARWPLSMLTTSTHDTKRSEDVRARLNVLSEMPEHWMAAVERWSALNEQYRTQNEDYPMLNVSHWGLNVPPRVQSGSADLAADGKWPDRSAEYLLYQVLVGAWPLSTERAVQYMQKAGREAKRYTSWTEPNAAYEEAVENFIRAILADRRFLADLEGFVADVVPPGRINALAQTLLKLTAPGVPDIYQGTELWDLSLVDPDNRRPVDFEQRRALLAELRDDTPPEAVMAGMEQGLPKLWLIRQALATRSAHPEWFGPQSSYTPLPVVSPDETPLKGEAAGDLEIGLDDPALAYLRAGRVLVAVPRLAVRRRADWQNCALTLPPGRWRSRLTHEEFEGGRVTLEDLFRRFPAALLVREE